MGRILSEAYHYKQFSMSSNPVVTVKKAWSSQIGPKGSDETYSQWIKLPTLVKAMLLKLYERISCDLDTFNSMGTVLVAKSKLDTLPAMS